MLSTLSAICAAYVTVFVLFSHFLQQNAHKIAPISKNKPHAWRQFTGN